jgi:hypothetical protein
MGDWMGAIDNYLANLPGDAQEVDLSSFELIEDFDDATWTMLKSNRRMKRVTLPPLLLAIPFNAFVFCRQLTNVTFPSSLRSIGNQAFMNCFGLAMRDMKLPDNLVVLGNSVFANCHGLSGKLTTHITGKMSFAVCTGLTALDLENCKVIAIGSFSGCTGLIGKLKLPSSLQRIEERAFRNCARLTGDLIIPPFVSFIHPTAFQGCQGMTKIEQSIEEHFVSFESWKVRGNVLLTLITFDEEYRREIEENGGRLHSDLSNSFLSGISSEAQLIYKATAHVDGTDNLANGICRLILSFLPMKRKYYGTQLSNEEIDRLNDENS